MSDKPVVKNHSPFLNSFKTSISSIALPEKFTFPFYYEPHELAKIAAKELQEHLVHQTEWQHDFGFDGNKSGEASGKMFGVLVVQSENGELGYLAAFSGKMAGSNHHSRFVPPVFDILEEEGFYKKGEVYVNAINAKIEALESSEKLADAKSELSFQELLSQRYLSFLKRQIKKGKKDRDAQRLSFSSLSEEKRFELDEQLRKQSLKEQYYLKQQTVLCKSRIEKAQMELDIYLSELNALKEERKVKSSLLQQDIFEAYSFLNEKGESRSLFSIFKPTKEEKPPAGAGECAAPKLLQFAFLNHLKPIALAEFWWGISPASEIRKHLYFYPACRGKCEPILGHMLNATELDENPLLKQVQKSDKRIEVIFEDEHIAIINKPFDFLSVPGKTSTDSVYDRLVLMYPNATGPLVVHRLDMSTSGLMIIALTKEAHFTLQRQFIKRVVKKRYLALLDGVLSSSEGEINLPLRVDLDDRPRQMVCFEHGKPARTIWKTIEQRQSENKTLVYFYPITGRTHQLRVHASHPQGLNTPIVGDDLYGEKTNRLHLHAQWIKFIHPATNELVSFELENPF